MPITKTKNLTSAELAKMVAALKPGGSFTVTNKTERGVASAIAKNLRNVGAIDYIVASRENEAGEFVFFIVPS